ncbi:hypothetical protein ACHQM5_009689 [Ranunculus cassubicifolius]
MEKDGQAAALLSEMRSLLVQQGFPVEKYVDPWLMRFLLASSMNAAKAAKMVTKWKKWRDEIAPLGYVPDAEVLSQLEMEKVYLQGISARGHPVVVVKLNKNVPANDQLLVKKFSTHLMDKIIASSFKDGKEIGNEKCVGILDMDKLSYKNVDFRGMTTGFQIFQAYYPQRMEKMYIVGMPKFFVGIWRMLSYFLDKSNLDRVMIVQKGEANKIFLEEIGEEVLPEEYGGQAKLTSIQDVTVNYPKY